MKSLSTTEKRDCIKKMGIHLILFLACLATECSAQTGDMKPGYTPADQAPSYSRDERFDDIAVEADEDIWKTPWIETKHRQSVVNYLDADIKHDTDPLSLPDYVMENNVLVLTTVVIIVEAYVLMVLWVIWNRRSPNQDKVEFLRPPSGDQGFFPYIVTVVTGSRKDSGLSSGQVKLTLHGRQSSTEQYTIPAEDIRGCKPFTRGNVSRFLLYSPAPLGDVKVTDVELDSDWHEIQWHLSYISVVQLSDRTKWYLPCHRWLKANKGQSERHVLVCETNNTFRLLLDNFWSSLREYHVYVSFWSSPVAAKPLCRLMYLALALFILAILMFSHTVVYNVPLLRRLAEIQTSNSAFFVWIFMMDSLMFGVGNVFQLLVTNVRALTKGERKVFNAFLKSFRPSRSLMNKEPEVSTPGTSHNVTSENQCLTQIRLQDLSESVLSSEFDTDNSSTSLSGRKRLDTIQEVSPRLETSRTSLLSSSAANEIPRSSQEGTGRYGATLFPGALESQQLFNDTRQYENVDESQLLQTSPQRKFDSNEDFELSSLLQKSTPKGRDQWIPVDDLTPLTFNPSIESLQTAQQSTPVSTVKYRFNQSPAVNDQEDTSYLQRHTMKAEAEATSHPIVNPNTDIGNIYLNRIKSFLHDSNVELVAVRNCDDQEELPLRITSSVQESIDYITSQAQSVSPEVDSLVEELIERGYIPKKTNSTSLISPSSDHQLHQKYSHTTEHKLDRKSTAESLMVDESDSRSSLNSEYQLNLKESHASMHLLELQSGNENMPVKHRQQASLSRLSSINIMNSIFETNDSKSESTESLTCSEGAPKEVVTSNVEDVDTLPGASFQQESDESVVDTKKSLSAVDSRDKERKSMWKGWTSYWDKLKDSFKGPKPKEDKDASSTSVESTTDEAKITDDLEINQFAEDIVNSTINLSTQSILEQPSDSTELDCSHIQTISRTSFSEELMASKGHSSSFDGLTKKEQHLINKQSDSALVGNEHMSSTSVQVEFRRSDHSETSICKKEPTTSVSLPLSCHSSRNSIEDLERKKDIEKSVSQVSSTIPSELDNVAKVKSDALLRQSEVASQAQNGSSDSLVEDLIERGSIRNRKTYSVSTSSQSSDHQLLLDESHTSELSLDRNSINESLIDGSDSISSLISGHQLNLKESHASMHLLELQSGNDNMPNTHRQQASLSRLSSINIMNPIFETKDKKAESCESLACSEGASNGAVTSTAETLHESVAITNKKSEASEDSKDTKRTSIWQGWTSYWDKIKDSFKGATTKEDESAVNATTTSVEATTDENVPDDLEIRQLAEDIVSSAIDLARQTILKHPSYSTELESTFLQSLEKDVCNHVRTISNTRLSEELIVPGNTLNVRSKSLDGLTDKEEMFVKRQSDSALVGNERMSSTSVKVQVERSVHSDTSLSQKEPTKTTSLPLSINTSSNSIENLERKMDLGKIASHLSLTITSGALQKSLSELDTIAKVKSDDLLRQSQIITDFVVTQACEQYQNSLTNTQSKMASTTSLSSKGSSAIIVRSLSKDLAKDLSTTNVAQIAGASIKYMFSDDVAHRLQESVSSYSDEHLSNFAGTVVTGLYERMKCHLQQTIREKALSEGLQISSANLNCLLAKADKELKEQVVPPLVKHIMRLLNEEANAVKNFDVDVLMMVYAGQYIETIVTNAVLQTHVDLSKLIVEATKDEDDNTNNNAIDRQQKFRSLHANRNNNNECSKLSLTHLSAAAGSHQDVLQKVIACIQDDLLQLSTNDLSERINDGKKICCGLCKRKASKEVSQMIYGTAASKYLVYRTLMKADENLQDCCDVIEQEKYRYDPAVLIELGRALLDGTTGEEHYNILEEVTNDIREAAMSKAISDVSDEFVQNKVSLDDDKQLEALICKLQASSRLKTEEAIMKKSIAKGKEIQDQLLNQLDEDQQNDESRNPFSLNKNANAKNYSSFDATSSQEVLGDLITEFSDIRSLLVDYLEKSMDHDSSCEPCMNTTFKTLPPYREVNRQKPDPSDDLNKKPDCSIDFENHCEETDHLLASDALETNGNRSVLDMRSVEDCLMDSQDDLGSFLHDYLKEKNLPNFAGVVLMFLLVSVAFSCLVASAMLGVHLSPSGAKHWLLLYMSTIITQFIVFEPLKSLSVAFFWTFYKQNVM